ncbi:polysaccharide deacetylase family protein [Paenibacillus sp. FSL E2-0190]|uniref:polysaccharide deacetylase n=1 Tax=Paenibacillus sp. FSL E2-0190 TaxID=2954504 RepID=UPI0030EF51AC
MKGNKNTHGRRNLISGLLVMVVIVIVMLGWNAGESVDSWMNRSLHSASAESVSVKNNLPLVAMQELLPKAESIVTASPEVKLNSSTAQVSKVSTTYSAITAAKKASKTVYITFDDGPSDNTFNVLKILQQQGVKATFFVLGNQAKSHPELINAIWEQGHAIGNHTYNHNYHDLYSGFTEFWSQIKKTEEIVRGITGVRPQLIRAPGGTFDHFDNTYFNLLKQAGYIVTDWTVDSGDSKRKGVPASEILKESTADLKSSRVILLLHDGGGHQESVKALPDIIARYKAAGYSFGLLDETVEPVQFRVSSKANSLGRVKPSEAWITSNIIPNAELFAPGKPLVLEVGKLETKLAPGEYALQKGKYMVPLRAVIERLGGQISWDAGSRSGKIAWNGKDIIADVANKELLLNLPDHVQKINGASVEMIGGSIWVSLRELLETADHPPLNISVTEGERRVIAF